MKNTEEKNSNCNTEIFRKAFVKIIYQDGRMVINREFAGKEDGCYVFRFRVEDAEKAESIQFYGVCSLPMRIILSDGASLIRETNAYQDDLYLSRWYRWELEKREEYILKCSYMPVDPSQIGQDLWERLLSESLREEEFILDEREYKNEIKAGSQRLSLYEEEIEELHKTIREIRQEAADKENSYQEEVARLKQEVLNKEGHIELLLPVDRDYQRITHSLGWRIVSFPGKIIELIFPVGTGRRKALGKVYLYLHAINKTNFLFLWDAFKKGGFKQIGREMTAFRYRCNNDFAPEAIDVVKEEKLKPFEKLDVLTFPQDEKPTVSIVIPVYNQFEYTYLCLNSILKNSGDKYSYEIIIADDVSTDDTVRIQNVAKNITVVRNKENLRFLLNCKNAAKEARGKYLLFLNNDTQVQENWLTPLVDLIESADDIGMVGSKLVYPDGSLQEAGGIIWKDASGWNYGSKQNAAKPEFNYVKEADYISGAAIMIRRDLWDEIGGFDERFVPAYYEDTDLAFEVRAHGYRVMYQPLSVVVHFEGVSNGTDLSSGQKAYQVANCQKFYEKWKDVLEKENFPNAENVFLAKDRGQLKKQILVVDHYVPHYDKDAGGKCTYMYLLMFVKMGLKVTFIGDNFYKHEPYTTDLNQHGIEVLYGNWYYQNWESWLKENLHYFDYVYLQRPHISIKYIDLVKQYSHAKVLYFAHDLHHVREYREYLLTKDEEKLKSSERWKKIEYELFDKADVGHVVGSYEQGVMQKAFPGKPIRNIPLYIYNDIPQDINKDFRTRNDLIYVGGFGHPPNIDAVLWFGREVFPLVLKKYPEMKWHVVGGSVPEEVKALAGKNILIEGFQPDEVLHEMYRTCRLAVVPLRVGAGVKGKVVEAAYYQIPLVTTSIGAEGLSMAEGNMVVEDDAAKMAELICSLYEDYDRLRQMSDAGKDFIGKYFTEKKALEVLEEDIDPKKS